MLDVTSYGLTRTVELDFDSAEAKVRETLKEQGFGILTEIDVQTTLKNKLNADFIKYKILGACNPPFAHKALLAEREIGLLMPCNVIVYEDESGKTHVAAMDPATAMGMVKNQKLAEVAGEVRQKLMAALRAV